MGDTDGLGTNRRRMGTGQVVAAVGGCAGPPQPEEHHTSQRSGILASAAFAALVVQPVAPVAVHPDGKKMPATEVQEQRWVGDIESARVHASNRGQRSTPSIQAELAAGTQPEYHHPVQRQSDCVYSLFPKRVTLR